MQHEPCFDFVKRRFPKVTIQSATAEYIHLYYPEVYEDAKLIANEAIVRAERLTIPEEAGMPDDLAPGVQLVAALFEERAA